MARRNGSSTKPPFPIVPVALGAAAALGLLYVLSRSRNAMAPSPGFPTGVRVRGIGPEDETWFPFVNTIQAGQTFKAYKGGPAGPDTPYSALSAPDRSQGFIRARNLETKQDETVPLYTINRLGIDTDTANRLGVPSA